MRILVSGIFILGALVVGWSVRDLVTSPSADDIRRERAAITAWPSVSGDLQEVRLQKVKIGRESAHFEASVRYHYLVEGVPHQGTRLGLRDYREDTPEALVSRLAFFLSPANVSRLRETTDKTWGEAAAVLEPGNQQLTVYYDPANPASSILDPRAREAITSLSLIAPHVALILIGSLMMVVSFLNWRRSSRVAVPQLRPTQSGDAACPGTFTVNDLRGEYWLYSEGALRVNIGCGGISGVCHFNTSDVHLESGGPLEIGKVAEILLNLMLKFGTEVGGYKNFVLHRDGKYDLSDEQIAQIDRALRKIGFTQVIQDGNESRWSKK